MADSAISQELNPALVLGEPDYADVTRKVAGIVEGRMPRAWYIAIACTGSLTLVLGAMLAYLVFTGIGVWGNNSPVGWAWDITNFVFWIGIGHAGTLISAILFLFRQKLAHLHQPLRRGDDPVRRGLRRHLPAVPHRPSLARHLLAVPRTEPGPAHLAELPQPADVGRLRGQHVRHGIGRCSGTSA